VITTFGNAERAWARVSMPGAPTPSSLLTRICSGRSADDELAASSPAAELDEPDEVAEDAEPEDPPLLQAAVSARAMTSGAARCWLRKHRG